MERREDTRASVLRSAAVTKAKKEEKRVVRNEKADLENLMFVFHFFSFFFNGEKVINRRNSLGAKRSSLDYKQSHKGGSCPQEGLWLGLEPRKGEGSENKSL